MKKETLNRSIIGKEMGSVIKMLPKSKKSGLNGFTGEFYQIFKRELILRLLKLLQNIENEEIPSNSFYIPLIPKHAKIP